jgi:hypothetical protein
MPRLPILILPNIRPNTRHRLAKRLVQVGECLEFTGMRNKAGYGFVPVMIAGKRFPILAHRLAWALAHNKEPLPNRIICHRCNNPSCCNPEHLYLGTPKTNAEDMVRAGHSRVGVRSPMYGKRGTEHPRSKYTQLERDFVIGLRQKAMPWKEIMALTGITHDTGPRWWKEWLKEREALAKSKTIA